jgi:hypothetical protein
LHYIIVKRGKMQDYDGLYKVFGSRVPVVWIGGALIAPSQRRATRGPRSADKAVPRVGRHWGSSWSIAQTINRR